MGHTVSSQRIVIDRILGEFEQYKKSLRQEDKEAFDRITKKVKIHIGNISYTTSFNTWAIILLSIILEQEKEIMQNESHTNRRLQIKG